MSVIIMSAAALSSSGTSAARDVFLWGVWGWFAGCWKATNTLIQEVQESGAQQIWRTASFINHHG